MPPTLSPSAPNTPPWRAHRFAGLFFDEFDPNSAWLREVGVLQLPPVADVTSVRIHGEYRPHPDASDIERSPPRLECWVEGRLAHTFAPRTPGPFEAELALPPAAAERGCRIELRLRAVAWTNFLAWLGRVTQIPALRHFRAQNKNRQLRLTTITTPAGEPIYDFSVRLSPLSMAFTRAHARYEFNIVGFLTAELGVGESARCMVRAADAAGIATALVPLKLHCKNRSGDQTYAARLRPDNPYRVNVVHIDAPAARDIDHHHGRGFRAAKYNVGYLAWELTEFPDSWVPSFAYFEEIWTPSDFVRDAIAMKCPLPVLTMPHAIGFTRPASPDRLRFGLPPNAFLFLFLCDLNSYSSRKNPQAVIEAFRQSGLAGHGAALAIKVQNAAENPADFAALQNAVRDLPNTTLITGTLTRAEIYELEAACDCFVSLHRSEGFGLAIAECMYLGKPVITTDWSASAEYVNRENACPVRYQLVPIEASRGPYSRGQWWAEPEVAHAAEWMRQVFEDRAWSAALGAKAAATIEQRFAPSVIGARYRRRLESIATF